MSDALAAAIAERDNALIQNDLAIRYWKGVARSQDAAVLALREAGEELWAAVSQTPDHTEWFAPLAKLRTALTSTATLAAEIEERIRADERERCAKLCDQQASFTYNSTRAGAYQHIAEVLRGKPGAFTDETIAAANTRPIRCIACRHILAR